jgi:hypothetical protein
MAFKDMPKDEGQEPTEYKDVNHIVEQTLAHVRAASGNSFVAMYLGGSLATRTFNPETSDVDFVVVTRDEITDDLAAALRGAHERITAGPSKWAKRLEGLYVPRATLATRRATTQRCAYLGVGGWFGAVPYQNDWIVQLHLVREHGIVVAGPHPKALIAPIAPAELRDSCAAIMRDWELLLETPKKFDAEYQAYTVLTMCRMLYTLEHSAIAPKSEAARWAKAHYGSRWSTLTDSALAWRHGMPFDDLDEVLDLLRYTIDRSRLAELG